MHIVLGLFCTDFKYIIASFIKDSIKILGVMYLRQVTT